MKLNLRRAKKDLAIALENQAKIQKDLIIAQENLIIAQKNLIIAQKDFENSQKNPVTALDDNHPWVKLKAMLDTLRLQAMPIEPSSDSDCERWDMHIDKTV